MEYCDGGTVANRLKVRKVVCSRTRRLYDLLDRFSLHSDTCMRKDLYVCGTSLTHPLTLSKNRYIVTWNLKTFCIERMQSTVRSFLLILHQVNFRDKRRLMTSAVGSPWYLAPEQIKRLYDEKCDVWALGVCVFWILGHPPFGGKRWQVLNVSMEKRVRTEWNNSSDKLLWSYCHCGGSSSVCSIRC